MTIFNPFLTILKAFANLFYPPPGWKQVFQHYHGLHISASAELAISKHHSLTTGSNYLTIYTDGCGINGYIGASAVTMFSPWSRALSFVAREKRSCKGSDQQFTV